MLFFEQFNKFLGIPPYSIIKDKMYCLQFLPIIIFSRFNIFLSKVYKIKYITYNI